MTQDNEAGNARYSYALIAVSLEGVEEPVGFIQHAADAEGFLERLNTYHIDYRDNEDWYDEHPACGFGEDLDVHEIASFTLQKVPYIGGSQ